MGNSKSKGGRIAFEICAVTGDVKNASEAINDSVCVKLVFHDIEGATTPPITLEHLVRPELRPGSQDKFPLPYSDWTKVFGRLSMIEVWMEDSGVVVDQANTQFGYAPRQAGPRDPTKGVQWFCEKLVVRDRRRGPNAWEYFYFPMNRWLYTEKHYWVQQLNSVLPQFDPLDHMASTNLGAPDIGTGGSERELEINENRKFYLYEQKAPGFPVQSKFVPMEEEFSNAETYDLVKKRSRLLDERQLLEISPPPALMPSIAELLTLFKYKQLSPPAALQLWMRNNASFGAQRLRGCNPLMLRLVVDDPQHRDRFIPDNFGVTPDMIQQHLDGWTLPHAIASNRIFIANYRIMDGIAMSSAGGGVGAGTARPMVAPMALFFLSSDRQLQPLAIQLQQHGPGGQQAPVFLPTDPPNVWYLAKQWFNLADAIYSQLVLHFAQTHMVAEGVYLAMKRTLSSAHPVFQLLMPHLNHICIVNAQGMNQLLYQASGWVDRNLQIGREGAFQLIARAMSEFDLELHGSPMREIDERGLMDEKVLPNYPYREDAVLLYKVLYNYVHRVLLIFYDNEKKLEEDHEIQEFRRELVKPIEHGGVGLKGVPGGTEIDPSVDQNAIAAPPVGWKHVDELTESLTAVLYLVCIQHAAVCNPQYDETGFPPNYTPLLNSPPPVDLKEQSLQELALAQTDRRRAADLILTAYLFGESFPSKLGHLHTHYLVHPRALAAQEDLKRQLEQAGASIRARNLARPDLLKYPYLDPKFLHNFICA